MNRDVYAVWRDCRVFSPQEELMVYFDIAAEIGRLVDEKNAAYGDSFRLSGEIMARLYPEGIRPEQYRDALGIIRVIDKLFRIATRKDAFGESPWKDIAGYGILGAANDMLEIPGPPLVATRLAEVPDRGLEQACSALCDPHSETEASPVTAQAIPAVPEPERKYTLCVSKGGKVDKTYFDDFPTALGVYYNRSASDEPGCLFEILSPMGLIIESRAS